MGCTVRRHASTQLLQVNGVTCHAPIIIEDCAVTTSSDIMLLLAIITCVAASPCFCLNGGNYDGNACVCVGDYFGNFCSNTSGKGCSSEQKLHYTCIGCAFYGLVPMRCWALYNENTCLS